MPVERIIGIDFGTSTSVVKVKTYRDKEPLGSINAVEYVHFDNKDSLPTLAYRTIEGEYLIGYEAENAAVKGTLFQNFKMDLISPDAELRDGAIKLTELFFKYMYEAYYSQKSHFPDCDMETTYVSYPAKWPQELRDRMINIASSAGFKNVKGLDEPTAAIHAVMVLESEKLLLEGNASSDILMIDMGAGTTDLVLCRYTPFREKQIEILNTWPKTDSRYLFGGREIDEVLCDYIKAYLIDCGLPNTKNFNEKYLDKCKTWKEANLSPIFRDANGVVKYCGFIDALLSMLEIEKDFPPLSRSKFEDMLVDYLSQFPKLVSECLRDINYNPAQLDYVILTGGHSQWYFTSEILEGKLTRFGNPELPKIANESKRIIRLSRPQETVALGLVYQRIAIKHESTPPIIDIKDDNSTSIKVTGIINFVLDRFNKKNGIDLRKDNLALKRLADAARGAAAELAVSERTEINIPYISANSNGPLHLNEKIARSELTLFIARYQDNKSVDLKKCSGCGRNISKSAEFCGYCGKKFIDTGITAKDKIITKPDDKKACSKCGKQILSSAVFCGYCGNREVGAGDTVKVPEPKAQEEMIYCPNCGGKISAASKFCRHCGGAVKNSGGSGGTTLPDAPTKIVIKRESQFVCMAVSYKVFVNGVDYGTIAAGETIVASSKIPVVTVEIFCTTIMMTNHRIKMKLRLEKDPLISFKLQYGGQIIPTVTGAKILEQN